MTVKHIKDISNDVADYLKTKDKSIIRRFIFLFRNSEERVVFVLLYRYYIKRYLSEQITRDDLFNSIINEKINQLFNGSKNTIFEHYNLSKTIYKKLPL